MLTAHLRGVRATYTKDDGWRSADGLTERHLRNVATPEHANEASAFKLAKEAWGGDAEKVTDEEEGAGPEPASTAVPVEEIADEPEPARSTKRRGK